MDFHRTDFAGVCLYILFHSQGLDRLYASGGRPGNPNYKFATEVFSEDGKVLGTYSYSKENRVFVGYNDLSPNIINALIATEDVRFAEHSGIDAYALTRAVVKRGILMQKNAGGGSTITQQLSKQLYSPSADM